MAELLPACLAWVLTTFAVYCFKCVKSRGASIRYFLDNLQKIVNNDEKRRLAAASAISFAPPQAAELIHFAASPLQPEIASRIPGWFFASQIKRILGGIAALESLMQSVRQLQTVNKFEFILSGGSADRKNTDQPASVEFLRKAQKLCAQSGCKYFLGEALLLSENTISSQTKFARISFPAKAVRLQL